MINPYYYRVSIDIAGHSVQGPGQYVCKYNLYFQKEEGFVTLADVIKLIGQEYLRRTGTPDIQEAMKSFTNMLVKPEILLSESEKVEIYDTTITLSNANGQGKEETVDGCIMVSRIRMNKI